MPTTGIIGGSVTSCLRVCPKKASPTPNTKLGRMMVQSNPDARTSSSAAASSASVNVERRVL